MLNIAAGQTQTASGIIRDTVDLGAGATLSEPPNGWLSIFGPVVGPTSSSATLCVATGGTLYAAGPVDASVSIDFAGLGGTLDLADLYLPELGATISGYALGNVINIISGSISASR